MWQPANADADAVLMSKLCLCVYVSARGCLVLSSLFSVSDLIHWQSSCCGSSACLRMPDAVGRQMSSGMGIGLQLMLATSVHFIRPPLLRLLGRR